MLLGNRDFLSACALLCVLALDLGGCATTQVEATWLSPEYAGRKIEGKILVVGVTRDETVRRLYEDAMAMRLHGRGVDAVRSYDLVSARLAESDSSLLIEAAKRVGATRILSTAIVGRTHVQRVEVEPVPLVGWTYYGWYGYYWPYGYARTDTYEFDRYYASTTLTEVGSGKVYWSARTRSDASGRIEKEVDDFASVMADTLARDGLL
jgi:hypothetical protein